MVAALAGAPVLAVVLVLTGAVAPAVYSWHIARRA
jgi:hypothetical protein